MHAHDPANPTANRQPSTANHPDITVIGSGLAGLRCARLLAARGLRVVLLDRKASIAAPVHTTGIFVRKTWEDFPLPEEQLGPPIRDVVLYSPSRRSIALRSPRDEFRVGRMSPLYLELLGQCAAAGVRWIPSARVTRIDGTRVTYVRSGKSETLETRFVVGADGARSTVAEQLGLDRNTEMLVGVEEIVAPISREPVLHCFLTRSSRRATSPGWPTTGTRRTSAWPAIAATGGTRRRRCARSARRFPSASATRSSAAAD